MTYLTSARIRWAVLATITTIAVGGYASTASAATLTGHWAPFTGCPVNEPAMLNAPASAYGNGCVASSSPNGTFKINSTTVTTGSTSLQFGIAGTTAPGSGLGNIVPAPDEQTLVAAPAEVPGGLLGLMCPSNIAVVPALCEEAVHNGLNNVTAQVRLAGRPTDFSVLAGLLTGRPIVNLPVKVQLQNPLLGSGCYIGSNAEPIMLRPETTTVGGMSVNGESYNGYSVSFTAISGSTLRDTTFAVPGANGCAGLLAAVVDEAIDLKQGLPSPSGKNELVLDSATSNLALTEASGQDLAAAWNAAVEP